MVVIMADGYINLKTLNMDELAGVVNLYPWFGAARKELCLRMAKMGGEDWGEAQYAQAALYIGSRRIIGDILRAGKEQEGCADKDVEELLSTYVGGKTQEKRPKVRAAGGDFFSQDEYDSVRQGGDNIFATFVPTREKQKEDGEIEQAILSDFCTETLAEIYTEQGYYEQAKYIYSKLILRYPEKSAYFATLIEKLEKNQ